MASKIKATAVDGMMASGRSEILTVETQLGNLGLDFRLDSVPDDAEEIDEQIQRMAEKFNLLWYWIGKRLAVIRDNKLFLPLGYSSFENYINQHVKPKFNIGKSQAYNVMYVAQKFEPAEADEYGQKLALLRRLANQPDDQIKVAEWIKQQSPSYREVERKVRDTLVRDVKPKPEIGSEFRIKSSGSSVRIEFRQELSKDKRVELEDTLQTVLQEFVKAG